MRRIWGALAAGIAAALLAGCGGGGGEEETTVRLQQKMREVHVVLNGYDGAENVGILMADKLGYFREAGLQTVITSPATPDRAMEYVLDRTVEIGVSHQPQVVMSKAGGASVVAVGSVIPKPTAAMIWLEKSKIAGIADLKGKAIAVPGVPFQRSFLQSVLAGAGLTLEDVKVKTVPYGLVSALAKGRADAIFGGSWASEGAVLESRGLEPVITRVEELGIPSYDELTVIVRPDFLAKRPQVVRDFMAAVARGTAAAIGDPKAAVALVEESIESNPDLSRKATEATVAATLPELSEDGYMDPGQTKALVDWMRQQGLIDRGPPLSELLTNDYLAAGNQEPGR